MAQKQLRQLNRTPYARFFIYGPPGSGKSYFSLSAGIDPRTAPVLVLNAMGNPEGGSIFAEGLSVIDMNQLSEFNDPWSFLANGQSPTHALVRQFSLPYHSGEGTQPYKTVIIDQLTDVQQLAFQNTLGTTNIGPGTMGRAREFKHFGAVLEQTTRFAREYYNLPMHVIMTCQEYPKEDPDTGMVRYGPALDGNSRVTVPSYALLVMRLSRRGSMRSSTITKLEKAGCTFKHTVGWTSEKMGNWNAKVAYPGHTLGDAVGDPTITTVLDKIYGVTKDDSNT